MLLLFFHSYDHKFHFYTMLSSPSIHRSSWKCGVLRSWPPQNDSHVTGTATLTKTEGGGVRVELDLSGLPKADALYLSHIHPEGCAEGEPPEEGLHNGHLSDAMAGMEHAQQIEWALSEVRSGASGNGTSTTTLKHTSLVELLSGAGLMHVNVHAPGSGERSMIACANLYQGVSRYPRHNGA